MLNALTTTVATYSGFGNPYTFNFIGLFVKLLIESMGSIGLGIIVFTLILKLVTLPLDVFSRVSSKKMSLKQEAMKPELERLQRQYANNKELYQKKMSALYKKQGVSMLSSCLPMIVTIVFFILVINQFTTFSNYTNINMINEMSNSYTQAIVNYNEKSGTNDLNVVDKGDGKYTVTLNETEVFSKTELGKTKDASDNEVVKRVESGSDVYYIASDINELGKLLKYYNDKGFDVYKVGTHMVLDSENKYVFSDVLEGSEADKNKLICGKLADYSYDLYIKENVLPSARDAAANTYREMVPGFIWVKNLWVPDLPWKHPILSSISEYRFKDISGTIDQEEQFAEITYNLSDQKSAPNGYLILVVLSIGIMFLSQFVMQRSQKTQMQLSSVNGQGAQTQKMMMWMMPIMFGIFAFIYNASFSIYMIISSAISTLSTIVINKIVEKRFRKKAEEQAVENDKRFFKK